MQKHIIVEILIEFTAAKIPKGNIHKARKQLFFDWKHPKFSQFLFQVLVPKKERA